jgi:molecular chaperone DnaK
VFNLDTSPARPKGQPKLAVEFRCDENGRITAMARDADTGKENFLTIALNGQRSEVEVTEEAQLMSEATVS